MLQLPHPLLADDVDFRGIFGRSVFLKEDDRTPGENNHENTQGDDGPGDFQNDRTFNGMSFTPMAAAELRHKHDDGKKNGGASEEREQYKKNVEKVYIASDRRSPCRPKW